VGGEKKRENCLEYASAECHLLEPEFMNLQPNLFNR